MFEVGDEVRITRVGCDCSGCQSLVGKVGIVMTARPIGRSNPDPLYQVNLYGDTAEGTFEGSALRLAASAVKQAKEILNEV